MEESRFEEVQEVEAAVVVPDVEPVTRLRPVLAAEGEPVAASSPSTALAVVEAPGERVLTLADFGAEGPQGRLACKLGLQGVELHITDAAAYLVLDGHGLVSKHSTPRDWSYDVLNVIAKLQPSDEVLALVTAELRKQKYRPGATEIRDQIEDAMAGEAAHLRNLRANEERHADAVAKLDAATAEMDAYTRERDAILAETGAGKAIEELRAELLAAVAEADTATGEYPRGIQLGHHAVTRRRMWSVRDDKGYPVWTIGDAPSNECLRWFAYHREDERGECIANLTLPTCPPYNVDKLSSAATSTAEALERSRKPHLWTWRERGKSSGMGGAIRDLERQGFQHPDAKREAEMKRLRAIVGDRS